MKKIINFIKEYWYVVGAFFLASIVFIYWFQQGTFLRPTPVNLPLTVYDSEIDITLLVDGDLDGTAPVFQVDIYDKSDFESFLQLLDLSTDSDEYEDSYKYGDESRYSYYYPSTGLAFFTFETPLDVGIQLDSEISDDNVDDVVKQLHDKVFSDLPEFRVLSNVIDENAIINIDYVVDGYNSYISSYHLNGSALQMELTNFGKVNSMSMLMISGVELYERVPIMDDEELSQNIILESFPKSIGFEVTDSSFSDLHPAIQEEAYLSEARISEFVTSWVYFNRDNGYALPMYLGYGSGVAEIDSLDQIFGADVLMVVAPIDPNYVIVSEEEESEETEELEDDLQRQEGDLFIGGSI